MLRKTLLLSITALLLPLTVWAADFSILSPTPDSVVTGNSVTIKFSLPSYLKLVDYQKYPKNAYGQGHIHLWLDQAEFTPQSAIKITSDTYVLENVKPGPHTLTAELVTNTHTSLLPKTTTRLSFSTTPASPSPAVSYWMARRTLILSITSAFLLTVALFLVSQRLKKISRSKKAK